MVKILKLVCVGLITFVASELTYYLLSGIDRLYIGSHINDLQTRLGLSVAPRPTPSDDFATIVRGHQQPFDSWLIVAISLTTMVILLWFSWYFSETLVRMGAVAGIAVYGSVYGVSIWHDSRYRNDRANFTVPDAVNLRLSAMIGVILLSLLVAFYAAYPLAANERVQRGNRAEYQPIDGLLTT